MTRRHATWWTLSALAIASPIAAVAIAAPDKHHDHDAARQAVLRREVLPLPRILTMVSGYQPGDVVEVELKNKRGMLFYDVDVLVPSGVVRELKIDARSGKLLSNTAKGE